MTKCVSLASLAAWPGLVNAFCLPLGKKYVKKYRINVQFYSVRNKQILNTHKIKLIISKYIKKIKRNKKGQKFAGLPIAASWPMIVNVFAEILHQLGTSCSHLTLSICQTSRTLISSLSTLQTCESIRLGSMQGVEIVLESIK